MKIKTKHIAFILLLSSCRNAPNNTDNDYFTIPANESTHKVDSKAEFEFQSLDAKNLNTKAIRFAQNGNVAKADALLKEANELEPNNPVIISNIANVEVHNSNLEKSIELYNQSIKLSDSLYYPAIVGLALVYAKTAEYDKSISLSQFAIKKDANNPDLYYNLILAQVSSGACSSGENSLNKLKQIVGNLKGKKKSQGEYVLNASSQIVLTCE